MCHLCPINDNKIATKLGKYRLKVRLEKASTIEIKTYI